MNSLITLTAISLGLMTPTFADDYSDLADQGYRWVAVNGPYACTNEKEVRRILNHHSDATELQVMQAISEDVEISYFNCGIPFAPNQLQESTQPSDDGRWHETCLILAPARNAPFRKTPHQMSMAAVPSRIEFVTLIIN